MTCSDDFSSGTPCFAGVQADAPDLEGGQRRREILLEVGAELIVELGSVPDRVLLSTGEDRDGLDQFGIGRQRPVDVGIRAQDVSQGHSVGVVGLRPGDAVTLAVPSYCHGIDRVDLPAGGAQAGEEQTSCGFDGDGDGVPWIVTGLGEQAEQLAVAFRVIVDVPFGDELTGLVHQGHVMVILGPVDSAGDRQT